METAAPEDASAARLAGSFASVTMSSTAARAAAASPEARADSNRAPADAIANGVGGARASPRASRHEGVAPRDSSDDARDRREFKSSCRDRVRHALRTADEPPRPAPRAVVSDDATASKVVVAKMFAET
jgi:hypothetical protein